MSNIFYGWAWMKIGTLSRMGDKWCQSSYVSRMRKSSFLFFFFFFFFFFFDFVLLFCRLLCLMLFFNGVALVSWFQWWNEILATRLTIFTVNVNHDSWRWLVLCFQGSGRMWMKKNYMKLTEERKRSRGNFGGLEEIKFRFFKLWSCWVHLDFGRIIN